MTGTTYSTSHAEQVWKKNKSYQKRVKIGIWLYQRFWIFQGPNQMPFWGGRGSFQNRLKKQSNCFSKCWQWVNTSTKYWKLMNLFFKILHSKIWKLMNLFFSQGKRRLDVDPPKNIVKTLQQVHMAMVQPDPHWVPIFSFNWPLRKNTFINCHPKIPKPHSLWPNPNWLVVVYPPLWKIWVRQLGWWNSQYFWENTKNGNQTTNQLISTFMNPNLPILNTPQKSWFLAGLTHLGTY